MTHTMPKIQFDTLAGEALSLAREIAFADGGLRKSKPKKASGRAKYVWRMVAFTVSPVSRHQCMPVTADFDLYEDFDFSRSEFDRVSDLVRAESKRLDKVADEIINTVPKNEWHGVMRWGRALGAI